MTNKMLEHAWEVLPVDKQSGDHKEACSVCGTYRPTEEEIRLGLVRFEKCLGFKIPAYALFEMGPLVDDLD